jgi:hypothetical protein
MAATPCVLKANGASSCSVAAQRPRLNGVNRSANERRHAEPATLMYFHFLPTACRGRGTPGDYAAPLQLICCNLSETDEFDSQ